MPLTAALLFASAAAFSPYAEECAEIARLDAAANACPLDRAALKARTAEALGGFPERTPLNARTVGVVAREGCTIEKVVFESRPHHHVTAHLFLPDPAKFPAPHPAILMPCGHADEGKLFPMHHRAGVVAARGGFAALMCDPVDQGERRQRVDRPLDGVIGHTDAGLRAHLLGWNMAQFRVWDGIRAVDYLCSRKDIDAKRLGVSGYSGGGTLTAYLNLMDDRFATACPMAFITDFPSLAKGPGPQDPEQVIHGQLSFGLNHLALLTSAFPKPVCPGFSFDDFFPYAGSRATFALAGERYASAGFADRIDNLECPGRHGWYASEQQGLVLWMRRWLNGDSSALPFDRDALRALDSKNGFEVCPDGEVLPGGVMALPGERSVFDILRDEYVRLAAVRGPLTPENVRRAAGIWVNIPGAPRASTVDVRIEDGLLAVSDGVSYDRGVKDYWYTRGGPREELAAMMSWRGANLVARQAEEIIRSAERSERRRPFVLRATRETAVAAAHAFYLRRDLFSAIELENPPPSWTSALEDPSVELRFADLVYGALRVYDWTDLIDCAMRKQAWPLIMVREASGPIRAPERTKEVLALHRRYPGACDEMWLAHGAGACLEDVRTAFEKLASYRPILEDLGIAVGFQQGVTLGHQDIAAEAGGGLDGRIAAFPEDAWQRDDEGRVRRMFCPRSPALHEYEREYLKNLGETLSPESIWLDDDLRLGLGVPGCFCDRCLAAFSGMCGEPLSREKLVARLRGGAEKDPIRRVWRKFKSESLAEYCKVVRTAVYGWKAPPRLALQTVGSCEMGSGVDWFPALRALSGPGKRPVGVRAGHGNYCENFGELLPKLLWVARESERCRDVGFVASVAYEQENYRREILHKSVGAALIESALALFAGCDALTEYRWDAARDEPLQDCGEFLSRLEAWRPFYERVSRGILATRAAGLAHFVGSDVDLLSGDTIDVSTDDDLQRCGVPIAPDTAPKATVRYVDRWSLPAMNAADVQSLAEGRLVVDASVVDGLRDAYGAPVADALASGRWKAYPLARFRRSVNQLPTTAEWNELLDLLDEMGKVPVRLEYPRSFRIWPRVDDAGRLRALGVWNMSIGGVTPTVAKVAATGIARACSPDGKKVDIAINEGRMLIPALPAMGVLWIEFE